MYGTSRTFFRDQLYRQLLGCIWVAIATSRVFAQTEAQADPEFPQIYNSETEPGEPITPQQALASLQLPNGFSASLFAAEPDVQNPIAATLDAQGRVWVAENYTYAERSQRFDLNLNDRIVVLEDKDDDGVAEKRTVFSDNLKMLTGIVVGRGGVWAMCPPQLLFIPDADNDLVPDDIPQVRLDGFHVASENYHNFANGLSWGPDNWLYGRCGASCPGELGLPGTTDDQRVALRGGIWRFHPERKIVEALNQGTTNPWGHDWNDVGELFFINTVNGHLWHSIPGAHYVRPHTLDTNPYAYELIDMHADHWHFDTGKSWTASRDGAANDYGGGHAHIGMMIYHGEIWPQQYRGSLFTVNMHGRRVNQERLVRNGSGYIGQHAEDFLLSDDTWFRGMDILETPDGNALLIDWSDTGECHDATGVHRTSGRVFKISYTPAQPTGPHAKPLSDPAIRENPLQLADLCVTGDTWQSRRAQELLAAMATGGKDVRSAADYLRNQSGAAETVQRLRALWALNALGLTDEEQLIGLLADNNESIRSWAIRLLSDRWAIDNCTGPRPSANSVGPNDNHVKLLLAVAGQETSPAVRLTLASTLQRLPYAERIPLASILLTNGKDAQDHNLPLMVWYGLMPLADQHLPALVDLAVQSNLPTTTRLLARRIADLVDKQPRQLDRLVSGVVARDAASQKAIVEGIALAFAGRKQVPQPKDWPVLQREMEKLDGVDMRASIQNLSIIFGDGQTIDELKRIAADGQADIRLRSSALNTLVQSRAEGIEQLCLRLLDTRFLNTVAAAGLSQYPLPQAGDAIVKSYKRFHPSERPQAISVLVSRKPWALSLLNAVARGQIDKNDITPFQARQIASHGDVEIDALLASTWGQVRVSPADKRAKIEFLSHQLTDEALALGDKSQGRAIFQKSCSSCHKLFGVGGSLGPDLTGAQRSNLGYLLDNIVDPSAVVNKQFCATIVLLDDGRTLNGLLTSQTETTITLASQDNTFSIPVSEVLERRTSELSTMPEGLLANLNNEQLRDLFAYLQSTSQVPLP
ncbi:MAG: c-type cytochrome [Planctomycetales bacterium]|nr:c-type cytochrome [Planctomycetales bacterium]